MPLPPYALIPGTPLGRYQLERQLAIGGMAEVYLARSLGIEGFEKRVVLKRILPQFAHNPAFVEMFLNEARLAAQLDHPNIVQVHDIEERAGSYFIAMEYVAGQDLRNLVKRAQHRQVEIPVEVAVAIGLGMATGLHYAHECKGPGGTPLGIVHRDVSLSNVLVAYNGAVKVTDFGIAKALSHDQETGTGTLKGKVSYMSPEQCRGLPLDRRSDVFSIGIVLYELVTGQRLFGGKNEFEVMQAIVGQDVAPPSQLRKSCPPALEAVVLKALRRDPEQRFASARELHDALQTFARDTRLDASVTHLADYMAHEFSAEIAAESDVRFARNAQRAGSTPGSAVIEDPSIEIVVSGARPWYLRPRTWIATGAGVVVLLLLLLLWPDGSARPQAAEPAARPSTASGTVDDARSDEAHPAPRTTPATAPQSGGDEAGTPAAAAADTDTPAAEADEARGDEPDSAHPRDRRSPHKNRKHKSRRWDPDSAVLPGL